VPVGAGVSGLQEQEQEGQVSCSGVVRLLRRAVEEATYEDSEEQRCLVLAIDRLDPLHSHSP